MNRRRLVGGATAPAAVSLPAGDRVGAQTSPAGGASESTDALWSWDAVDLAAAIVSRQISSREATMSCLARIEAVNPELNAVAEVLAEEALAAADLADQAVAIGGPVGRLHGVPVTVKINVDMRGHATTDRVVAFKDDTAADDSSPVRNLRRAGAIIIGRTNTPAFSFRYFTENDLHGRTLNPLGSIGHAGRLERGRGRGGGIRDEPHSARQRHCWIGSVPRLRVRRGRPPPHSRQGARVQRRFGAADHVAADLRRRAARAARAGRSARVAFPGGGRRPRPVVDASAVDVRRTRPSAEGGGRQ